MSGKIGKALERSFAFLVAVGICVGAYFVWPTGFGDVPFASMTFTLLGRAAASVLIWAVGLFMMYNVMKGVDDKSSL